ncbi:MAG: aldehyde dehydrogenase family protein [Proteobacteria bacterium]|nr:aldehyde dehydrogenase family protein [Pseudomonadota bacterium]
MNVKADIKILTDRARVAQQLVEGYSQEQVDELITAMVWSVARSGPAEKIARLAVEETRLGNYEGKLTKMASKCRAALADIIHDKSVGVIEADDERNLIKIAKPIGVVGALTPTTHPEASPVVKAIAAVKGRNAIIIAPHPRGKKTCQLVCEYMRDALEACGAPRDLIINMEDPTLEHTGELMKQVDVVLATGGGAMVKAAYSSGTPAFGVGAGNAVIIVDETADIDDAVTKIHSSKTFDLAASCSADNTVIGVEDIYAELVEKLQAQGGYLASDTEYQMLAETLWSDGHLNPDIIAQSAQRIGELAGISIPQDKSFIMVPESGYGPEHPFSGEKLSVVMALYKVENLKAAIELTNNIQEYSGYGHSCGLFTSSDQNVLELALGTKTSRVMVNQPQASSNSGALWNGMRQTFSLGCGSWGGNVTTENITWRHLVNITWVSKPLATPKTLPSDEELFGAVMEKISTGV